MQVEQIKSILGKIRLTDYISLPAPGVLGAGNFY